MRVIKGAVGESRTITVTDAHTGRVCALEVPLSHARTWPEAHRAALDFSETRDAVWEPPARRGYRRHYPSLQ